MLAHATSSQAPNPASWAVLIPSFNHAEDVVTCLRSLWEADPRPGEVLVVDDASTENAVQQISGWANDSDIGHRVVQASELDRRPRSGRWLTIATAPVNGGFVRTCNIGLRHFLTVSDVPFVLLLNNDAAVAPNYFAELARAIQANPGVGVLSGLIYEWDRKTVWYAGGRFNPLRALATHDTEPPHSADARETGYVSGCSMLIARGALEKVGLLGECFAPCYVEDVDFSLRVRAAGYGVMFAARAVCYHRVGSSLGRSEQAPGTLYSVIRNRAYTVRRNYRGWRRAAGVTYMAITKPGRALLELAKGKPRTARAILSGMVAGVFLPIPSPGDHGERAGNDPRERKPLDIVQNI